MFQLNYHLHIISQLLKKLVVIQLSVTEHATMTAKPLPLPTRRYHVIAHFTSSTEQLFLLVLTSLAVLTFIDEVDCFLFRFLLLSFVLFRVVLFNVSIGVISFWRVSHFFLLNKNSRQIFVYL